MATARHRTAQRGTRHRRALLPVVGGLMLLTGCGGTDAPPAAPPAPPVAQISGSEVATIAEDQLEQTVGIRPTVECFEDVEARVGATTRCLLSSPGMAETYGVTATVTSVTGDQAHFDVTVDEQPQAN